MAQCIGRKGEGRNVLEGRNDLALLLDVDTVLCKLSVYCVELFCCNFSPSRIDGQVPVGMLFLFIVDGSKCRWVHDSPGDEKLKSKRSTNQGCWRPIHPTQNVSSRHRQRSHTCFGCLAARCWHKLAEKRDKSEITHANDPSLVSHLGDVSAEV